MDKIDFSNIETPNTKTSEELNFSNVVSPEEEGQLLTPDQVKEVSSEIEAEKKFGDSPIKAAALGALSSATFGISDQILTSPKIGKLITGKESPIVEAQTLRELEERNKTASMAGEISGIIGSVIVPFGGAVSAVTKVGKIAEGISEKTLAKILAETGKPKIAMEIIKKGLPKTAGLATEGAFYGAGQLIHENALGTADFNAENLVASVGTGAILGGLAGAVFSGVESLTPTLKKGVSKINENVSSYLDPKDAALDLIGMSPVKKMKLKKNRPDLVEDLPIFLRDKAELGVFTTDKKLFNSVESIKEEASEKIGNILNQLEEKTALAPNLLPSKKELYTKIISDLDENFINKFKNSPEYQSKLAPIKRIRAEYDKLASSAEGNFSPIELNSVRKDLDAVIKYDKVPGTTSLVENANRSTRKILRNEIDAIADRASKNLELKGSESLLTQLKAANKDFSIASEILPYVEGKIEKKKLLSFTDVLGGAGLIGLLKETGAAIAITKKLAESDIARRLKVLTQIETENNNINKEIGKSVKSLINPEREIVAPTSINILLDTAYSRKDMNGRRAQTKEEAFNNVKENFSKIGESPDVFMEKLRANTLLLQKHAPASQAEVLGIMQRAVQFLESKMPKDPKSNQFIGKSNWKPSSVQLAKFERYIQAVEDPKSVFKDIQSGSISVESVEALRIVYPNLYKRLQNEMLDTLNKLDSVPYKTRLQIGLILGVPTDPSLVASNISKLQSNFKKQSLVAPKQKALKKIGESLATPLEKNINRD